MRPLEYCLSPTMIMASAAGCGCDEDCYTAHCRQREEANRTNEGAGERTDK